jgi:hypothetical protein
MMCRGYNLLAFEPAKWIPDPTQCKWFRRAMALVHGQDMLVPDDSTKPIPFDPFDALCDEFITDK